MIGLISLLLALTLPALGGAQERARYARWQSYSHDLTANPELLAYYNFEHEAGQSILRNMATGDAMSSTYHADKLDGSFSGGAYSAVWDTEGRFRGKPSLNFQTPLVGEAVTIESQPDLYNAQKLTVMAWVRAEQKPSSTYGYIVNRWSPADDRCVWSLNFRNNQIEWRGSADGDDHGDKFCRYNVSDLWGSWIHVAGSYDGKTLRLYVNGQEQASKNLTNLYKTDTPLWIGAGQDGTMFPMEGHIDEVALFRRALTADEIKQHYDMGRP